MSLFFMVLFTVITAVVVWWGWLWLTKVLHWTSITCGDDWWQWPVLLAQNPSFVTIGCQKTVLLLNIQYYCSNVQPSCPPTTQWSWAALLFRAQIFWSETIVSWPHVRCQVIWQIPRKPFPLTKILPVAQRALILSYLAGEVPMDFLVCNGTLLLSE